MTIQKAKIFRHFFVAWATGPGAGTRGKTHAAIAPNELDKRTPNRLIWTDTK